MAVQQPRTFGYRALTLAALVGAGIIYVVTSIPGWLHYQKNPAEEAAREFFMGQKSSATYNQAEDELSIKFNGLKGLNQHHPNDILVLGADGNDDGLPDTLGRVVIREASGREIKTGAEAAQRINSLDKLTISIEPAYRQVPNP